MTVATDSINRSTSGVVLPAEVANEIWAKTIDSSAIMQLAHRVELPGGGKEFQIITGEPEAAWVNETDVKPVSKPSLDHKLMRGYTMSCIIPFSNQFRRDKEKLYQEMISRAPMALGAKLDKTVYGLASTPGENFDAFGNLTNYVDLNNGAWEALVAADTAIAMNGSMLNGWILSPAARGILLAETDTTGRPLFVDSMTGNSGIPSLMGRDAIIKKAAYDQGTGLVGFAGDWDNAYYGVVEDISVSITDQATITIDDELVSLWERNMFACRFEFEVGFRVKDEKDFVAIYNNKQAQS